MKPNSELYVTLSLQMDELEEKASTASDQIAELYQGAISKADLRLAELANDPDVRKDLSALGEATEKDLRELDDLKDAADLGLVSEEQLTAKREEILSDPARRIAAKFIERTKLVAREIDSSPDSSSAEATAETNHPPRKIRLTIRDGGVISIGDKGKIIKLSSTSRRDIQIEDFSLQRESLLRALVTSEKDSLNAVELWEIAFPGQELDKNVLTTFRNWMQKLTYRKQPLILHNGKRGPFSEYFVNPDFDLSIAVERVSRKNPVSATVAVEQPTPSGIAPTEEANDPILAKQPARKKEAIDLAVFPLTLAESTIVASFISNYSDLLHKEFEIEVLPEQLLEDLSDATGATEIQDALSAYATDPIFTFRKESFEKIITFFSDQDTVIEALDSIEETDPRYPLFAYLCGIEGEDRWQLLQGLLNARRGIVGGFDIKRAVLNDTRVVVDLDDGTQYDLSEPENVDEADDEHEQGDSQTILGDEQQAPVSTPIYTSPSPDAAVTVELPQAGYSATDTETVEVVDIQTPDLEPETAATPELAPKKREFAAMLRHDISEWVEVIEQFSLIGKKSGHISEAFRGLGFTGYQNSRVDAIVGALTSGSDELSLKDILMVNIGLSPRFKAALTIRHSSSKPDSHLVNAIVNEAIREFQKRQTT